MNADEDTGTIAVMDDPSFWSLLRDARSKFLGLDYDGTLAPFRKERMDAVPLRGIIDLLKQIEQRGDTVLAVISGRPLFELIELLGDIPVTMVGSHGFEFRNPSGEIVVKKISSDQEQGLVQAQTHGIEAGLEDHLEMKRASLALHTRGVSRDQEAWMYERLHPAWEDLAPPHNLEIRRFNGGIELRARGWNKGDALESLLVALADSTLCIYLGDDETDEDAFERIRPYGIGIRVGGPTRLSKARGFVDDIGSVKRFLLKWTGLPFSES